MSGITLGHEIIGSVNVIKTEDKLANKEKINVLDKNINTKKQEIGTMRYDNEEYVLFKIPKSQQSSLNIKEQLNFNGLYYTAPSPLKPQDKNTEITKFKEIQQLYEEKVHEVLDFGSVYILTNISNQILFGGGNMDDSFDKKLTIEQKNDILNVCAGEKTFDKCNKTLSSYVKPHLIIRQKELGPRKILIIGAGPVGLLTGYLFKKKLGDNIHVIILENRLVEDGTRQDFQRIQTMRMPQDIWEYLPESIKEEFKRLRLGIDLHKTGKIAKPRMQVLPIKLIEKLLLNEAKKMNVILRYTKSYESVDKIKKFVNDNNIDIVIDATGGRIKSDTQDELVKLPNEIRTPDWDWYEPLIGLLISLFGNKYTMSLRHPSNMRNDFKYIVNGLIHFYRKRGLSNSTEICQIIQSAIDTIMLMDDYNEGIKYTITQETINYYSTIKYISCSLVIYLAEYQEYNYKTGEMESQDLLIKYDTYDNALYNTSTGYKPIDPDKKISLNLKNKISYGKKFHSDIISDYTPLSTLGPSDIDKEILSKKLLQKHFSNITYDPNDNFYYYTKPGTTSKDYQFGYITIHGKLIGKNRLQVSSTFDYNQTNDWLTSCGIDWDENKIIVEPSDTIELSGFDESKQKLPDDFPYNDVYDYLAISLNENEYNQIKTIWESTYDRKSYISHSEFSDILKTLPWLTKKINDSIKTYYDTKNLRINFTTLGDIKYDVTVSKPFEIRPGFRVKSSSVKVLNDIGDRLYVMVGDSLFQPHFYGTGGFRRGAENSKYLADLIFEHFFGTRLGVDKEKVVELKEDIYLQSFGLITNYINKLQQFKNTAQSLPNIIKCNTRLYGIDIIDILKGTDTTKLIVLASKDNIKYITKFYLSINPKYKDYNKQYQKYHTNNIPNELAILQHLNILDNNTIRHTDTPLKHDICNSIFDINEIQYILNTYCKDDKIGICAEKIKQNIGYPVYNNIVKYSINKYAEYGTLVDIIKKNNNRLNVLTNRFEQFDLNTKPYFLMITLQLLWQMAKLAENNIIHRDIIPENIFIYVDDNYVINENRYYKYDLYGFVFYIKVLPFICKFADYNRSNIDNIKSITDITKQNIKNFTTIIPSIRNHINDYNISDTATFPEDINDISGENPKSEVNGLKWLFMKYIRKYKDTIITDDYVPSGINKMILIN
ncbi:protein kinase [Fadolivirus algeromassiliense]|jgi:hypothetical protein|uniref:Protein kinase n=1 Tax=Fadolivirus FV1/VV64 TaxID=3070911 RepID=A0A7D3V5L1_9VIRU|nr:protein kinase [Fadolivirus algeromassiliense]QKF94175.1 protein kinase [Fadolivirus FV1/VV64]